MERTKLDISEAWASAVRMVAANRDMLMAIAGVFFLLPGLALSVFMGDPQVAPGTDPKVALSILAQTYLSAAPLLILVTLLQMVGTLTVLIVMTDPARPTVAQAIRRATVTTPPYFGAQVLVGVVVGFSFVMIASLASLAGSAVLTTAVGLALGAAMIWIGLRVSLVAPVIATDGERNPLHAIRRSWDLMKGNSLRLALFLGLTLLLFLVVYGLVMMFVGVVLVLVTGGEIQRVLRDVVSSAISAVALVYLAAMIAAVHRQLAGPPAGEAGRVFE
ncbi:MAG: hypothetical protein KGL48_12030 [Sphingomonadales bacterium]|nr:hypothetical protein [Sphingomonadales bacterium]MDE2568273.1 hypothetical protein [Sphingomonadales bacterium]